MQTSVTFRHMNASDPLRDHAEEKLSRLKKYFVEAAEAHIVLSTERYLHKAEVNISAHGLQIFAKEISSDMYNSIDQAMHKVETQIKKYKSKMVKMRPKDGSKMKMKFKLLEANIDTKESTTSDLPPTIVETKDFEARPMMIDEAVMQMDLLHNDILVFLNSKTNHINVLYRKEGSKYGLIETSTSSEG